MSDKELRRIRAEKLIEWEDKSKDLDRARLRIANYAGKLSKAADRLSKVLNDTSDLAVKEARVYGADFPTELSVNESIDEYLTLIEEVKNLNDERQSLR